MVALDYYNSIANLIRGKRNLVLYLDTKEQINQAMALTDVAIDNVCREAVAAGCAAELRELACEYGDSMMVVTICSRCC